MDLRPQDVVARGYDAGADRFAAWQRQITGSTRLERLEELLTLLPKRPDVLELGSGAGVRSTRLLADRARLTGADISAEHVRSSVAGSRRSRYDSSGRPASNFGATTWRRSGSRRERRRSSGCSHAGRSRFRQARVVLFET